VCGCLCVSFVGWFIVYLCVCLFVCLFVCFTGFQWVSVGLTGFRWVSLFESGFHGFLSLVSGGCTGLKCFFVTGFN